MRSLALHPSVQLAWVIGNSEACGAGSTEIEPVHLLLGVLKVADGDFGAALSEAGLPEHVCADVRDDAAAARSLLTCTSIELRFTRRSLREQVRKGSRPRPESQLHRSPPSRALMEGAARRATQSGGEFLRLPHLLEVLLEELPAETRRLLTNAELPHERVGARSETIAREAGRETGAPVQKPAHADIDGIATDLTALAREGRLAPVVGRQDEMLFLARYLHRTSKRNVILVGEAGVGKTAVVEGLAQRIAAGKVPALLRSLRILQLSVGDLMAGTRYRGDMEARVQALLAQATSDRDVVLFIDEVHLVMGSRTDAPMDIANLLKPALARDDFRCIGATTSAEFDRHVKTDPAFMRRFQLLRVPEPSHEQTLEICRAWTRRIEHMQGVRFHEDAVATAVDLATRHIHRRSHPDKAIDLLENAAARAAVSSLSSRTRPTDSSLPLVTPEDVASTVEEQFGIRVDAKDVLDVEAARRALEESMSGQGAAIQKIVECLKTLQGRSGAADRPLGVLLFAGPSGVGKTMAAECLARSLFAEGEAALGRFNMSELKERHELARVIGAPPGFVGHEQSGALFSYADSHPEGLILLDEMEKAHPDVHDYFLQVFERGEARDTRGSVASFRRHLFVVTCNVGSAAGAGRIGFDTDQGLASSGEPHGEVLESMFRRELLSRIDTVVWFEELDPSATQALTERWLDRLVAELKSRHGLDANCAVGTSKAVWAACCRSVSSGREVVRQLDSVVRRQVLEALAARPNDATSATIEYGPKGTTLTWGRAPIAG